MDYIFAPAALTALPINGQSSRFPVRRVYCVGRNYAAHIVEMGGDPDRDRPFFFQKNPENLVTDGRFPYPPQSSDVHHEVELYLALVQGGTDVSPEAAEKMILGGGIAIDMTRRDLQAEAKAKGRPWTMGKAFEASAPVGPVHLFEQPPDRGRIALSVDGDEKQSGDLGQMIWKPAEIVAELSRFVELAPGDVILTGTPSGVGPVSRGARMQAKIDGLGSLEVDVV